MQHSLQQLSPCQPKKGNTVSVASFLFLRANIQNMTPLSRPLYIEVEKGHPSPYLKELLSKVGSSQIEFLDFTLEGHNDSVEMSVEDQVQNQQQSEKEMSIIQEEEESPFKSAQSNEENKMKQLALNNGPQEYIPNMHLLGMELSSFSSNYFRQTLNTLKDETEEKKKEFVLLYLTDEDLETYKDASYEELLEAVNENLSFVGSITRLERVAKVTRYLQKKRKRIWKKKINYDCRKKVADHRLRVKGKFVTPQQACQMLGIDLCSQQQLKKILKQTPKLIL